MAVFEMDCPLWVSLHFGCSKEHEKAKGSAMELTGKVALVTGAGSGIGKAAAILLAQQGVRVGALSRTAHEVEQTATEIERSGKEAMAVLADISHEDQMQ